MSVYLYQPSNKCLENSVKSENVISNILLTKLYEN